MFGVMVGSCFQHLDHLVTSALHVIHQIRNPQQATSHSPKVFLASTSGPHIYKFRTPIPTHPLRAQTCIDMHRSPAVVIVV